MFQTLIVDDERIEREGLKKLIQRFQLPLRVSLATNGQEALEQLRARPADLLLTDVRMPFMDGLELSKRALAEHPHLKVVLVSGFSEFEYARTALQLGISDYLLKPVQVSEFLSTMNKVIAGLRASASQKEEQLLRDQYMREHTLMMLVNGMPLESLRQPLEERRVTISRVSGNVTYPSDFMLVCAMNPCPCGYYPDRARCSCTRPQVHRYMGKVSGPILDRIDLCVELAAVDYDSLKSRAKAESSAEIRGRVERARRIQEERFRGTSTRFNGDIEVSAMERYCGLGEEQQRCMERLYGSLQLSARAYHRILRVARTIADLEGAEEIGTAHLMEASYYRPSMEYWGN